MDKSLAAGRPTGCNLMICGLARGCKSRPVESRFGADVHRPSCAINTNHARTNVESEREREPSRAEPSRAERPSGAGLGNCSLHLARLLLEPKIISPQGGCLVDLAPNWLAPLICVFAQESIGPSLCNSRGSGEIKEQTICSHCNFFLDGAEFCPSTAY